MASGRWGAAEAAEPLWPQSFEHLWFNHMELITSNMKCRVEQSWKCPDCSSRLDCWGGTESVEFQKENVFLVHFILTNWKLMWKQAKALYSVTELTFNGVCLLFSTVVFNSYELSVFSLQSSQAGNRKSKLGICHTVSFQHPTVIYFGTFFSAAEHPCCNPDWAAWTQDPDSGLTGCQKPH